jgi:nucleotide-binding universal stress UspA family protein
MFRHILVPLDGSPQGEHALPLALGIARRASASLQLVHVHLLPGPASAPSVPGLENAGGCLGQGKGARLPRRGGPALGRRQRPRGRYLLEGDPVDCIEGQARGGGADLLVMTTHGRGTFSRFWLGSVTDRLVRRLTRPVLVVRPAEEPADFAREPVLRRMLFPLDGSALAERALEPVLALGMVMGTDFTLLHVVPPVTTADHDRERTGRIGPDQGVEQPHTEEAGRYLVEVARPWRDHGLSVQPAWSSTPRPPRPFSRKRRHRLPT